MHYGDVLSRFLTVGVAGGSFRCEERCSGAESSPKRRKDIQRSVVSTERVHIRPQFLVTWWRISPSIKFNFTNVKVKSLASNYDSLKLKKKILDGSQRLSKNTKESKWKLNQTHPMTGLSSPHFYCKRLIHRPAVWEERKLGAVFSACGTDGHSPANWAERTSEPDTAWSL